VYCVLQLGFDNTKLKGIQALDVACRHTNYDLVLIVFSSHFTAISCSP